jgi:hypothetical protein
MPSPPGAGPPFDQLGTDLGPCRDGQSQAIVRGVSALDLAHAALVFGLALPSLMLWLFG